MYSYYMFNTPNLSIVSRFHILCRKYNSKFVLNNKIENMRSFSTTFSGFSNDITNIRNNLNTLHHDLTFVTSSSIKSQCQLLQIQFKDPSNSSITSKLSHLSTKAAELEKLVYTILDNRLRYNVAKNKKTVKDSNYKYGIVGVSLICVFGSLSLSLHPIFLVGCAVGIYFYRVVYKQSLLRKVTNINMESLIKENRINKQRLSFLIKVMLYRLSNLERDVGFSSSSSVPGGLHKKQCN